MVRELKEFIVIVKHPNHVESLISELAEWNVVIEEEYTHVFHGFRAKLGNLISRWIEDDPRIASIEPVEDMYTCAIQPIADLPDLGPWHLDRIDQRQLPISGNYTYLFDGTGITAYIIDSGAQFNHEEFDGRISSVDKIGDPGVAFDPFVDTRLILNPEDSASLNATRGFDENGHGTHVAGIIGSDTYGVAKNITLKTAKVFGSSSLTSTGRIISGLDAALEDYINGGETPSVMNMSLGGNAPSSSFVIGFSTPTFISGETIFIDGFEITLIGSTIGDAVDSINNSGIADVVATIEFTSIKLTKTPGLMTLAEGNGSALNTLGFQPGVPLLSMTSLERAIASVIDAGITVFLAAGNQGKDANLVSPARMPQAMTVGATDREDSIANFSNFGDSEDTILPPTTDPELLNFDIAVESNNGSAVEMYAPGVGILSTWLNSVSNEEQDEIFNRVNILSGTSMASPVMAGIGALSLENAPFLTPELLKQKMLDDATPGVIQGLPVGSFDLLAYSIFEDNTIIWLTPIGTIGEYNEGQYLSFNFNVGSTVSDPITYSLEAGILPVGVSIDAFTGVLSGIPALVATDTVYNFTVRAQVGALFEDCDFEITILDAEVPLAWATPSNLGDIEEGQLIDIQFSAISQNGVPAINIIYTVDGTLPHDWTLSSSGQLEGTAPIVLNDDLIQSFTLIADDGIIQTPRSFSLLITRRIDQGPPTHPYWQTPSGLIGTGLATEPFNFTLVGVDENGEPLDLTYHLTLITGDGSTFGPDGILPPGLSLNETTGEISGTLDPVSQDELFTFGVWITDGANVVGNTFTIEVKQFADNIPPEWVTPYGDIGLALANQAVAFNVIGTDVDNGPGPLTYNLESGEIPPGLTLFPSNGLITGVVDDVDESKRYVFTIVLSDGQDEVSRTFAISIFKVNTAPVWLTPAGTLGSFDEGAFINTQVLASDPHNDTLTYSVLLGALPPGLFLDEVTGIISGIALEVTVDELYVFTLRVDDSLSNLPSTEQFADREFSMTIMDVVPNIAPIWITEQADIPDATENSPYSFFLVAEDPDSGPSALEYGIITGALPDGLTINAATGEISGTPLIDGNTLTDVYNFVAGAYDGIDITQCPFTISVLDANTNTPPTWNSGGSLGTFNEGSPVSVFLSATDAESDAIFYSIVSGNLPPGLSLDPVTGEISGNALNVVTDSLFNFTARATDVYGNYSDEPHNIEILNVPNIAPVWVTPPGSLGSFGEGIFLEVQLEATDADNGPLPLHYDITSGALPIGVTLNNNTGLISGIANDVFVTTLYNFDISVTDGADSVLRSFSMEIQDVPAFSGNTTDLYAPISGTLKQALEEWNNDALIPDDILYLPGSPFFGRVEIPKVMVANRLHTGDPDDIQELFLEHHKSFNDILGVPMFAVVRDPLTDEVLYEVIYVPVIDSQLNSYFEIDTLIGQPSITSYNFDHLRVELLDTVNPDLEDANPPETGDVGLGFANSEILPSWMRSEQNAGNPESIIGYIPAVELAFVLPGTAEVLLNNLNKIATVGNEIQVHETTFDENELSGNVLNPIVIGGDQIIINNQYIITFTGGDVYSARDDIKQALALANVTNIGVGVVDDVIFTPNVGPGPSLTANTGKVLRFNFEATFITLNNLTGVPLTDLGLKEGLSVPTTFDASTTTFDKIVSNVGVTVGTAGLGLKYAGAQITFDRYAAKTALGSEFQLKWFPDVDSPYWQNQSLDSAYRVVPYFITPGGSLGIYNLLVPITIGDELRVIAESSITSETITYAVIFGQLPLGLVLDSSSGYITGTPTAGDVPSIFVIRASDTKSNFYDRQFEIQIILPPTTFETGDTSFDVDTTTFDTL